jgi:hypothetical protein
MMFYRIPERKRIMINLGIPGLTRSAAEGIHLEEEAPEASEIFSAICLALGAGRNKGPNVEGTY